MAKIIISGPFIRYLTAGQVWAFLNYAIGIKKLGHDVFLYEETDKMQGFKAMPMDPFNALKYWQVLMKKFKFGKFAFKFKSKFFGIRKAELVKIFGGATLLININGCASLKSIKKLGFKGKKVYLDIDPAFTQFWCHQFPPLAINMKSHDLHFTIGENIGNRDCLVPTLGIKWHKTRHPALLDIWTPKIRKHNRFTTISHWDSGTQGVYYKNKFFGYKSMEFLNYISLPTKVAQKIELATYGMDKDALTKFKENKWLITDARRCSKNISIYKKYIEDSKGEFTIARSGTAKANCGWIGDRNIAYLATGKPVILQETGISKFIPTGKGFFTFTSMQEAIYAINEVNKNYEYHCKEARKIAEKYFDSDKVLGKMLKDCGI